MITDILLSPAGRWLSGGVCALTLSLLAGCGKSEPAPAAAVAELPPAKVRVATVRAESAPALVEVTGTVRAVDRAQLAAKLMGAIEELPVALGQRVSRGDLLVKLGAGEINARVAQAQSQLNLARRDLEREQSLLAKGASTADMVKGLEDRFAAARAMLREAEVMLGYATIRAPFDGVVTRTLAQAGDLASPGQPLLEVQGTSGFEVEAGIPDSLAASLAPGASLPVDLPAAGVRLTGNVSELSPAADPQARTVTVKLALPENAAVRAGQFARIQIPGTRVRALLAPAAAIGVAGQMETAFVADAGNRAVLRIVKTGARRDSGVRAEVEILAGLEEGERLVVHPPPGLREGQPLELLP